MEDLKVHSIFVTVVIVVFLSSSICNLYHDVIDIFVISFCFQWGIDAELELPSELAKVLQSKAQCTYKEKIIPPGVATRNAWGPILFKYCRVQYNETSKKLEMVKREFAIQKPKYQKQLRKMMLMPGFQLTWMQMTTIYQVLQCFRL